MMKVETMMDIHGIAGVCGLNGIPRKIFGISTRKEGRMKASEKVGPRKLIVTMRLLMYWFGSFVH